MIVFSAGMPRSGSTFGHNIVREVLSRRGRVYQKPDTSIANVLALAGDADHVLMKAHAADEETINRVRERSIKAICTIRKPEDAVASWLDAFDHDIDEIIAVFREWFALYDRIRDFALTVSYEEIDLHPLQAARSIARYVCPDAAEEEISEAVASHSKLTVFQRTATLARDAPGVRVVAFSHIEASTLYHRRHVASLISRPARERMGDEAIQAVRRAFAAYTDADGALLAPRPQSGLPQ